jgi:[ribosomal protein S18]-alanine N-acetyltransferase
MRRSSPLRSIDLVLIRHAAPDDLPLIRTLEQQAETAAHWSSREYEALFSPEAPRRVVLIAADEAGTPNLRGFIIARCGVDEWEIENVVVALEEHRRGLGSALVGHLLHEARESGITSVLLEVRPSNTAARRLYEKMGFSEAGRRPAYYREPPEDALLLKISISFP